MSFSDPANPIQPLPAPPLKPPPQGFAVSSVQQHALEYLRAYNYVFENPEWMTTVAWGFC
jgi:hypothetical protein